MIVYVLFGSVGYFGCWFDVYGFDWFIVVCDSFAVLVGWCCFVRCFCFLIVWRYLLIVLFVSYCFLLEFVLAYFVWIDYLRLVLLVLFIRCLFVG